MGLAPTKSRVRVQGIWIHGFAGPYIVESWNAWDTLGLLQQLGAVPAIGRRRRPEKVHPRTFRPIAIHGSQEFIDSAALNTAFAATEVAV